MLTLIRHENKLKLSQSIFRTLEGQTASTPPSTVKHTPPLYSPKLIVWINHSPLWKHIRFRFTLWLYASLADFVFRVHDQTENWSIQDKWRQLNCGLDCALSRLTLVVSWIRRYFYKYYSLHAQAPARRNVTRGQEMAQTCAYHTK